MTNSSIFGASLQIPVQHDIISRQINQPEVIQMSDHEIMDAANNTGASVKRKEDMHKMAEYT